MSSPLCNATQRAIEFLRTKKRASIYEIIRYLDYRKGSRQLNASLNLYASNHSEIRKVGPDIWEWRDLLGIPVRKMEFKPFDKAILGRPVIRHEGFEWSKIPSRF